MSGCSGRKRGPVWTWSYSIATEYPSLAQANPSARAIPDWQASAGRDLVKFPENYDECVVNKDVRYRFVIDMASLKSAEVSVEP